MEKELHGPERTQEKKKGVSDEIGMQAEQNDQSVKKELPVLVKKYKLPLPYPARLRRAQDDE